MGIIAQRKMLERAMDVAAYLLRDARIAEVYLFGSLARAGDGRDIDLIIVPKDPQLAQAFLDQLAAQIGTMEPDGCYFGGPGVRLGIFYSLFGGVPGFGCALYTLLGNGVGRRQTPEFLDALFPFSLEGEKLDVFVLPADWQTSELVRTSLRTRDQHFLDHVKRDAVPFNLEYEIFEWPIRRVLWMYAYQLWRRYLIFEQKGARSNWFILSGILNQLDFRRRQRLYERENAAYRITLAIIRINAERRNLRVPFWLQNMNG